MSAGELSVGDRLGEDLDWARELGMAGRFWIMCGEMWTLLIARTWDDNPLCLSARPVLMQLVGALGGVVTRGVLISGQILKVHQSL